MMQMVTNRNEIYTPNGGTAVTTAYINEVCVCRGDSVEYINFEEGRIRAMQPVSQKQWL